MKSQPLVSTIVSTMLTDNKIKNLKPKDKIYPTADGNGLTLYTLPTGTKTWRLRYRYNGRADVLVLGKYPSTSLKEARSLKELYLSILEKGTDPKVYQKQQKSIQQDKLTFKGAFDLWIDNHQGKEGSWTERTTKKLVSAFDKHVFPYIGDLYVEDIKTPDVYEVLQRIDDKGKSEVLKKVKRLTSRVFKDCVVQGLIEYDPVTNITSDNFRKSVVKHYATVNSEKDVKELLLKLETYRQRGTYQVATALNLAPYLMLRPGEVASLTWKNIEFQNRLIRIFSGDMKMRREHVVPMSNRVYSIFKEIKSHNLCNTFVFPSPNKPNQPISPASFRSALSSVGISKEVFTTHGFRSMASTMLNEMGFNHDWIEVQLAHVDANMTRRSYNNALYFEQRVDMIQQWSDYLDKLKGFNLKEE